MTQIGADTPLWQTDIYMLIFGAGLGLNMQTIILAMQNSVEPKDMGVATSSVTFFRQMGGTLGTAVLLSVLFTSAGSHIKDELAKSGQQLPAGQSFDLNNTAGVAKLPDAVKHPILVGFSDAMNLVFLVAACIVVIAFVLSLTMKEVPLRTMSGMQAARAAAASEGAPPGAAAGTPTDEAVTAVAGNGTPDAATDAARDDTPDDGHVAGEGPRHLAAGVADDSVDGHGKHEATGTPPVGTRQP
jgi:hypothetical protein